MCFSYFIIGGLATTNMLRLVKGSTLHVFSSNCACPHCGMRIGPLNQMPIVSFFANRGKCKKCKNPIPKDALLLEIVVFVGMSVISWIFHFTPFGVLMAFCYYELIKVICVLLYGRREKSFFSQYLFSFLGILPFVAILEFMALLLDSLK